MIDILQHGDLELFHSSIIRWLMDPAGEHGLGTAVLQGLARRLADRGAPALLEALDGASSIDTAVEVPCADGRLDIVVTTTAEDGAKVRFAFENKTKSVGYAGQVEGYKSVVDHVVALGLCPESFAPSVDAPLLTYYDIRDVLLEADLDEVGSEFRALCRHYHRWLERELALLDGVVSAAQRGMPCPRSGREDVRSLRDSVPENTRRLHNLVFLERFLRWARSEGHPLGELVWNSHKNDRSGVWLSDYGTHLDVRRRRLPWPAPLDALLDERAEDGVGLWCHIELWDGVYGEGGAVGQVQLRASCTNKENNRAFRRALEQAVRESGLSDDGVFVRQPSSTHQTFGVIGWELAREDLGFDALLGSVTGRMGWAAS
ncbi:PD-(D/E)XK nuclease family protein [Myxococcota bacterium]|nr:PD-(D/E)XK nuclease family protein [Myxococcota bacterium]